MGLVDYISRNPFAKAKKVSAYDENFVVATISITPDSFKNLIRTKTHTLQKISSILKLNSHSYSSNQLIATQIPILMRNISRFCTKPVALQLFYYRIPLTTQLALKNKTFNHHLTIPIAPRISSQISNPQSALNNPSLHKSLSINKITANALQKSDNKECEKFE